MKKKSVTRPYKQRCVFCFLGRNSRQSPSVSRRGLGNNAAPCEP